MLVKTKKSDGYLITRMLIFNKISSFGKEMDMIYNLGRFFLPHIYPECFREDLFVIKVSDIPL